MKSPICLLTFLICEHPSLSPEQRHFDYQTVQPHVQPHLNLPFPCLPSGPGLVERLQCVCGGLPLLFSWLAFVIICVNAAADRTLLEGRAVLAGCREASVPSKAGPGANTGQNTGADAMHSAAENRDAPLPKFDHWVS